MIEMLPNPVLAASPIPDDAQKTRRSYRFRLIGDPHTLYATHLAVNRGVKAALDALATLRGGLHASLALVDDSQDRRHRMLVLTTCWFVAESRDGAPESFTIERPTEHRLREILVADGIAPHIIDEWADIVQSTLRAPIREDAVWIDRRAAFTATGWPLEAVGDVLLEPELLGDPWTLDETREAASDLVQITSAWLSRRLGRGEGADFATLARGYETVRHIVSEYATSDNPVDAREVLLRLAAALKTPATVDGICAAFAAPGHRSRTLYMLKQFLDNTAPDRWATLAVAAERDANACAAKPAKGTRPWSDAIAQAIERASGLPYQGTGRAHHGEYAVMLDHAARRLAAHHSWTLAAERQRLELENEVLAPVPSAALAFLDRYREERAIAHGGTFRPRSRALGGWPTIVAAWSACANTEERVAAVVAAQSDTNIERIGDVRLFRDLAGDDGIVVWRTQAGEPDPQILATWVALCERADARKAPMLRHVDAHRHPVNIDYGVSRFRIKALGASALEIGVVQGGAIITQDVSAHSKRFEREINVDASHLSVDAPRVARNDRLARLAAGADAEEPANVLAAHEIANARLIPERTHLERIDSERDGQRRERLIAQLPWSIDVSVALPKRPLDPRIVEALRARRAINTNRGSLARQELAGIPGLRVLGVDVGLRAAAACAVIETVTDADIAKVAARYDLAPPTASDTSWIFRADGRRHRYRRIAAGGPAPWARVEQTFVVRLPGETSAALATSDDVVLADRIVREDLGIDHRLRASRDLIALQSEVLSLLRLGVRRTAALARIARQIGGSDEEAAEGVSALIDRIDAPGRWTVNGEANVARTFGLTTLAAPPAERREKIVEAIRKLIADDTTRLRRVARSIRSLVRPQRRNLGGLSLGRIDVIERYYRTIKALLALDVTPRERFGERTLLALRAIRRERTSVLAARIVEAALGGSRTNSETRSLSREHEPCVAISIENLDGYQPSAARARRTNRLLRTLRSQDFADQLAMQCELHGLYLRRMPPAYTSRLDGVTGEAGILVEQVPIAALASGEWDGRANAAMKTKDARGTIVRAACDLWNPVRETWATYMRVKSGWMRDGRMVEAPTVLVPRELGPLFTTDGRTVVDADANAAIGLAMALVLDRDWPGAYTHVPCHADGRPNGERIKGGPAFAAKKAALVPPQKRPVNAWRTDAGWHTTTEYWAGVEGRIAETLLLELRRIGSGW